MHQALRDDVIIDPIVENSQSSNLFIPQTALKEIQGFKGRVISVGPKSRIGVSVGDVIVYRPHEGKKAGKYLVMAERHILALYKEE